MIRDCLGRLAAVVLAAGASSIAQAQVVNQQINQSGGTTHVHIYNNLGAPSAPTPRAVAGPAPMGGSYWGRASENIGLRRRIIELTSQKDSPAVSETGQSRTSILATPTRRRKPSITCPVPSLS